MMLKEKQFYDVVKQGLRPPLLTLREKCEILVTMLEEGELRLIKNRAKTLEEVRSLWTTYLSDAGRNPPSVALNQALWKLRESN